MATMLPNFNKPTVVDYGVHRFVIFDAPSDSNLQVYVKELLKLKGQYYEMCLAQSLDQDV